MSYCKLDSQLHVAVVLQNMNWNRILYEHGAKYELQVNGQLKLIDCFSKKGLKQKNAPPHKIGVWQKKCIIINQIEEN